MSDIVLLGDELHAVGLHLAGVATRCPSAATAAQEFAQAVATAQLVLLDRSVAALMPEGALQRAQRAMAPLVLVLPDLAAPAPDGAFVRQMRAVLGIEA